MFHSPLAIDDPHKVVKVIASDGKTAETKEIAYTNCKVIGNGSFGVVFQARMVGGSEDGKDIAIKKVLQDKRFKASSVFVIDSHIWAHFRSSVESRIANHEARFPPKCR